MGVGEQQSRFQSRIVDACLPQPRGRQVDGRADRLAQMAWLAARFAFARCSRRFRALASTDRRPAGVLRR